MHTFMHTYIHTYTHTYIEERTKYMESTPELSVVVYRFLVPRRPSSVLSRRRAIPPSMA